jgi:hypothetical protein
MHTTGIVQAARQPAFFVAGVEAKGEGGYENTGKNI